MRLFLVFFVQIIIKFYNIVMAVIVGKLLDILFFKNIEF